MVESTPSISTSPHTSQTPQPPARKFYIFGNNISHSLSPALHNSAFTHLSLPYHYSIHQSPSVDASVQSLISHPNFGGASVTYPHKLQIQKLLDGVSERAEKIGAVNTVVVKETIGKRGGRERRLVGDNTDWEGIRACILRGDVVGIGVGKEGESALILGAGGAARAACYAVQEIGIKEVVVVNRTRAKAEEMAKDFPELKFKVFGSLEELCNSGEKRCRVVVACVPADDLGEEKIPDELFSSVDSGVLVEMAYRPPKTGMMKVAERYLGWKVFKGTDVLEEQAYAQFTLWTGRPAPVAVMREAMMAAISARL